MGEKTKQLLTTGSLLFILLGAQDGCAEQDQPRFRYPKEAPEFEGEGDGLRLEDKSGQYNSRKECLKHEFDWNC